MQVGSFTVCAEVLGRVGAGRAQAGGADGNARKPAQRLIADAAFVGEEERKKSVRNLPYIRSYKSRDSFRQSTREGSPPPVSSISSQKPLLLQFLADDAMPGPGHRFEPLLLHRLAAFHAEAKPAG